MQEACAAVPAQAPLQCFKDADEAIAAEVLMAGFAWPAPPAQVRERRRPAPASTSSGGSATGSDDQTDSDGEGAEYRPRKVRVVPAAGGSSSAPPLLARRTYTWRGICCRRAEKQQRQLEALHQQQAAAAVAASPTHSSGSADTAVGCEQTPMPMPMPAWQQQQQQQAAMAAAASSAAADVAASSSKEGDRDWAALTTWLRMNIHNPRTAKKVVLFIGKRESVSGRWAFGLNPALRWSDVSADARHRLAHLPAEAAKAFARKYPSRPPGDWRMKSQKYKPPGTSQTYLVLLEDLVLTLHSVYQQHEGASSSAAPAATVAAAAAAASSGACSGAGAGPAAADQLASCGSSAPPPAPLLMQ